MLNNRLQRLEDLKPSKRYTTLKINILADILFVDSSLRLLVTNL